MYIQEENQKEFNQFLKENGFAIVDSVYNQKELNKIKTFINKLDISKPIFRKTEDLFAIRQFLKEIPEIKVVKKAVADIDTVRILGSEFGITLVHVQRIRVIYNRL